MSQMELTTDDVLALQALWQRVAHFPAGRTDEAVACFLQKSGDLIGAQGRMWVASVDDGIPPTPGTLIRDNWRIASREICSTLEQRMPTEERHRLYLKLAERGGYCPLVHAALERTGIHRIVLRRDVMSDEEWQSHWVVRDYLSKLGVAERMIVVFNLSPTAESVLVYDRAPGEEPFGKREKDLAWLAVLGLPRMHRHLFLERGLIAPAEAPLAPRQRDVLKRLLGDLSEKEIADDLGLSPATVHNHITRLFRTFGVSGRAALQAIWLGTSPN